MSVNGSSSSSPSSSFPHHPLMCDKLQWTSQSAWEWVFQAAIDARVLSHSPPTTPTPPPPSSSSNQHTPEAAAPPPPPPPPAIPAEEWIRAKRISDLPSFQKLQHKNTPQTNHKHPKQQPQQQRRRRAPTNCLLRVERDENLIVWFGGNAFDSLGDKDSLCTTCNSRSPDDTNIIHSLVPPTTVLPWDSESVSDIILPQCPSLATTTITITNNNNNNNTTLTNSNPRPTTTPPPPLYVLKPPLGCQGAGIHFLHTREEILTIIRRDAEAARNEPGFLDCITETKGRIPGWVVQTYVPSLLLDGKKFHVRAYVLVHQRGTKLETTTTTTPEIYYYDDQFEVRVASSPYDSSDYTNRSSHITNGAGGSETSRLMASEIPQLDPEVIRNFLVSLLAPSDSVLRIRIMESASSATDDGVLAAVTEVYTPAALDIMIDTEGRPWLLEVNARCPAAPGRGLGSERFREHLVVFAGRLLDLAVGGCMEGFVLL